MLKEVLDSAKDMLRDAIIQNLDIKIMFSSSNILHIANLGCSIGPNTFIAMLLVVQVLKEKYHNNNILGFQIFFNDHVTNDFNTLFQSLPIDRSYYAYGVPGPFHGRKRCPEELLDEKSPAWNKGLIQYEVLNAYVAQFEKDMEMFLDARAEEILEGGMMVLISPQSIERLVKFFGSSLIDLVNEA
ncbi:hypothetical protein P3S67_005843 [Capsicum chacoense]